MDSCVDAADHLMSAWIQRHAVHRLTDLQSKNKHNRKIYSTQADRPRIQKINTTVKYTVHRLAHLESKNKHNRKIYSTQADRPRIQKINTTVKYTVHRLAHLESKNKHNRKIYSTQADRPRIQTRKAPHVGANSSSVFAFDMHYK